MNNNQFTCRAHECHRVRVEMQQEIEALRQRVAELEKDCGDAQIAAIEANEYAERCTEANRQAELDNDELRAKLALAEQLLRECVEKREGLAYEDGLLRRIDAAIDASGEST